MTTSDRVSAWQPGVPGIREVFHARFAEHAYPLHTHDTWTLLIVDDGAVRYDLDHREHGALQSMITLLPPQVAHDGRPARSGGFRKRVIYLDPDVIGAGLIGRAVDRPEFTDPRLRLRIDQLHAVLGSATDPLQAESRLALITDRLQWHLRDRPELPERRSDRPLAARMRDLLDDHLVDGLDLAAAAGQLGVSSTHLIRSFTDAFGLPPHRYLTGRRIERARELLLAGMAISEVAVRTGFYDQAHLTRHLRRMIGTTPAAYRSGRRIIA
ncbi:AraC family transcriptional regulator [Microlunatus soli]|uniref:AraC-type DNA-binding protein n=1 Tax=Microlunatus soli TaxID=630515 RepID=A0A1H1Y739_9ACTN|nr:AraC family transcriptional regulator [Microlunatus soli]SDT17247.1 AraC-type DNA-binding protein [Microlunatus soli]